MPQNPSPRDEAKEERLPFSPVFLVVVFAVLLLVMAASFFGERQTSVIADIALDTKTRALETAEILSTLQDAELGQRGYLLTDDERFLDPYTSALSNLKQLQGYLEDLRRSDPAVERDIDYLQSLIAQRLALIGGTLELAQKGQKDDALSIVKQGRGKAVMDEIRVVVGRINTTHNLKLEQQVARRNQFSTVVRLTEFAGFIFLLIIGIVVLRQTKYVIAAQRLARDTADAANKAKSAFLASMSHELRTPMTGIMGMCDLLLMSNQSAEDRQITRMLTKSARTLLNLLNDILDFSKIEAGRLSLERVDFKLSQILEDAKSLFDQVASQKGILLEIDITAPVTDIFVGDPKRIQQVLFNLMSNAIKFTSQGRVIVRRIQSSRSDDDRTWVTIEVEDTGVGISDEAQARLFKEFEQEDASTTRQFGGTGLGLSISQRLVGIMGGSISVESKKGVGSKFSFTLPLREGNPDAVLAHAGDEVRLAAEYLRGTRLNILLAEDTPITQHLIVTMLRRWGHDVRAVGNGSEAVAAAHEKAWDVILMDMQMPAMDGPQAVAAIRAGEGPSANVPIIALTADAISENHHKYLSAGSNVVATKPIDWQVLAAEIAALVAPSVELSCQHSAPPNAAALPTPAQNEFAFDPSVLEELRAVLGNETLAQLLPKTVIALHDAVAELNAAVQEGDASAVKRVAHKISGIASQCGAVSVSALARKIEVETMDSETVVLTSNLLERNLVYAKQAIERYVAELSSDLSGSNHHKA
ncbi:MAG: CHASE3 domain-containing protein [Rhodospirillaceae bacterium]|nr:CHASE3 domain-containing protein [Rhodospirillaceae bacterium]